MQGRTAVLGLAAVLTLTLTSCGVRSEADRGTETGRLRSSQAEQDMVRNGRTMLEDGSYYAGTDGAVDRVRPEHESEWEKLGRDLRDGWDHLMNGTEEAVDQTGRAAFMPVRIRARIISSLSTAGPRGQIIFVFLNIIFHSSYGKAL